MCSVFNLRRFWPLPGALHSTSEARLNTTIIADAMLENIKPVHHYRQIRWNSRRDQSNTVKSHKLQYMTNLSTKRQDNNHHLADHYITLSHKNRLSTFWNKKLSIVVHNKCCFCELLRPFGYFPIYIFPLVEKKRNVAQRTLETCDSVFYQEKLQLIEKSKIQNVNTILGTSKPCIDYNRHIVYVLCMLFCYSL